MPQEVPWEMSRWGPADNGSPLSLVNLHKESPTDFAISFSASALASGVIADALTHKTLMTPIADRQGITRWWESNSSAATQDLFATQRTARQQIWRLQRNAEVASVKTIGAFLDSADLLDSIAKNIHHRTWLRRSDPLLPAFLTRRATGLVNEADSLLLVFEAKPGAVGAQVERALARNPNELTPALRRLLVEYKSLVVPTGHNPSLCRHTDWPFGSQAQVVRDELRQAAEDLLEESARVNEQLVRTKNIPATIEFLEKIRTLKPADIKAALGTTAEVNAGTKLFDVHSNVGLKLTEHIGKISDAEAALTELRLANAALKEDFALSTKALIPSSSYLQTDAGRVFKAFGLASISMGAGYGADAAIGELFNVNDSESRGLQSGARLAVDGCLVPALIMSDLPTKFKLPLAAAAFAAGRASSFVSTNDFLSPNMATLLKPNQADTFLVGTAVMTPLSGRYKAAAIAASIGVGRAVNHFLPEEANQEKSLLSR